MGGVWVPLGGVTLGDIGGVTLGVWWVTLGGGVPLGG